MKKPKGLFRLQSPADLLGKLRNDYKRIRQSPLDEYAAYDFFVTAEHMADWIYPGYSNKPKREALKQNDIILQITSHIANGSKHFITEASHHASVKDTLFEDGAFQANAFQANAFDVPRLIVALDGDAVKKLGSFIEVSSLAAQILEYWEKNVFRHID